MSKEADLISIVNKYGYDISEYEDYVLGKNLTNRQLNGIQNKIIDVQQQDIIGFIDITITKSGKEGLLFTKDKLIFKDRTAPTGNEKINIDYSNLKDAKIQYAKKKDCDSSIIVYTRDNEEYIVRNSFLKKIPLILCIQEIANIWNKQYTENYNDKNKRIELKNNDNTDGMVLECPNCGQLFEKGNKFCSECGEKLELRPVSLIEVMQVHIYNDECLFCGTKNKKDAERCNVCGTILIHSDFSFEELLNLYADSRMLLTGMDLNIAKGMSLEDCEKEFALTTGVNRNYAFERDFIRELEQFITVYTMEKNGWINVNNFTYPLWRLDDLDCDKNNDDFDENE